MMSKGKLKTLTAATATWTFILDLYLATTFSYSFSGGLVLIKEITTVRILTLQMHKTETIEDKHGNIWM